MKASFTENKENHSISISFYKIDYSNIVNLLNYLKVKEVSVFIDKEISYCFYKTINVSELPNIAARLNDSLLVFGGLVTECHIGKEIDSFASSKIMINTVLGERFTGIWINTKNTDISLREIKDWFKKL